MTGFNPNRPGTLYFVSFVHDGVTYYKVGITGQSVEDRFGTDWYDFDMQLLWAIDFESGYDARVLEAELLDAAEPNKINLGVLKSGNTEVLTSPIIYDAGGRYRSHDPHKVERSGASPTLCNH